MTGKRSLLPAALVLSAIAGLLAAAVVCSAHLLARRYDGPAPCSDREL